MPLSKKRNAELMRKLRYNRRLAAPAGANPPRVKRIKPARSCAYCDERRVVDSHHIDRNRGHNTGDNLVDLCPNCHALEHRRDLTQPKPYNKEELPPGVSYIDGDGHPVYE